MIAVGKAERNPAHHPPVVAELEVPPDQAGLMRQRALRNRAKAERLRRQHEIADIGPAIDRAIDPERLVGVDDGNMRRAEKIEIL